MKMRGWSAVVLAILVSLSVGATAQLQYGYYDNLGCPNVEATVRANLATLFLTDPTSPASILRVAFHDCQVGQGCDASIMLNGAHSELVSDSNFGIRRLDFIDDVKSTMEAMCAKTVSCADIIAMAGRDAVFRAGGPDIQIPLGRKDSVSSSNLNADRSLPAATSSVSNMLSLFGSFAMTAEESVAILGAHTLGVAHCVSIKNRLNGQDSFLGLAFGAQLRAACAMSGFTNATFINNDGTSFTFDNRYYNDVLNGLGLLTIDAEIGQDPTTAPIVQNFASDQSAFFAAFQSAYVKMTSRALTGSQGIVRQNCRSVN